MLDADKNQSVKNLQLYLTTSEAEYFRKELDRLLLDPEANDHSHIGADDMSREISFSILTPQKLRVGFNYAELERKIFEEP